MSGVKGRSGRIGKRVEFDMNNFFRRTMYILDDYISDNSVPNGEKVTKLMPFIVKFMPERVAIRVDCNIIDTPQGQSLLNLASALLSAPPQAAEQSQVIEIKQVTQSDNLT